MRVEMGKDYEKKGGELEERVLLLLPSPPYACHPGYERSKKET